MLVDISKGMNGWVHGKPTDALWDIQEAFSFQTPGIPRIENLPAQTKHTIHVGYLETAGLNRTIAIACVRVRIAQSPEKRSKKLHVAGACLAVEWVVLDR